MYHPCTILKYIVFHFGRRTVSFAPPSVFICGSWSPSAVRVTMRVAIVGAGWAGGRHADMFASMKGVEIAAVVARSTTRAKTVAAKVHSEATTDLGSVLRDDSIDAVDVCVPSGVHREIAVPALEAGKHVFMETPMALTAEDADAMVVAGRDNRRILGVAQLMKFVGPYVMIRKAFRDGDLGEPRMAHAARLSGAYWSERKPRDFSVYGDPMIELMIFEYEYLQWLFGSPRAVEARGVRGPTGAVLHALATLEYEDHLAFVEGSAMMPRSWPFTTYLRIQGTASSLETRDRFLGGENPTTEFLRYRAEGTMEPVEFQGQDPYFAECEHFVHCVSGKEDVEPIDGESAAKALAVALAARESVDRRKPVRIP